MEKVKKWQDFRNAHKLWDTSAQDEKLSDPMEGWFTFLVFVSPMEVDVYLYQL